MKSFARVLLSVMTAIALTISFTACSSSPKLYANEKYKAVGKEAAEADIQLCEQEADANLDTSKGKNIAKGAGTGAAIGGAIGGVAGLFGGNFGSSLLTGAAVGAAAGGTGAALTPDEIKRQYVNRCLYDKGYEVLGWD